MITPNRRQFLRSTAAGFAALAAAGCVSRGGGISVMSTPGTGYGEPVPDPAGMFDLPPGFSYRVISTLGDAMDDGEGVPDNADGMGCFDLGNGRIALVRNHEIQMNRAPGVEGARGYRRGEDGLWLAGGTTTIVLDAQTLAVEKQFRSLAGTHNNCAGGQTPWGSWLTCEEGSQGRKVPDGHGWVFEVPAAGEGLADPVPLKAMGRFGHEAACVDPASGIVYLTEDRPEGLLYRFIPDTPGRLAGGGKLQVLAAIGVPDTRNWEGRALTVGQSVPCRWLDIDDVEAPEDDLRQRGASMGASLFARGEGIHMGEGEFYFTCTNGGAAKEGQVFRARPAAGGGTLELFFESDDYNRYSYGDNLTIAPDGELVICEDHYHEDMAIHLRGISADGSVYPFAALHMDTELAGACFSPDGRILFVNAYSPTRTLAIAGPWKWLVA